MTREAAPPAEPAPQAAASPVEHDPEVSCALPFEAGACHDNAAVFTFDVERGECVPAAYGGCGGNANRFVSKAECQGTCGCEAGLRRALMCAKCGPTDGCEKEAARCLPPCKKQSDCKVGGCRAGVCLPGSCS